MFEVFSHQLLALFYYHFVGDFILQTDKMAINKSSSLKWLTIHCVTYSIPFANAN